jgi:HlyD family secretion protein
MAGALGARGRYQRAGAGWVPLIVLLLVAAALGVGIWAAFFRHKEVATVPVARGQIVRSFYATGVVRPDFEYVIKSKAQGALRGFEKREGASVKRGEVLGRVDDRQLAFEVEKCRAELEEARKQAAADAPEKTEIEARLTEAEAQVQIAKATLDRMTSSFEKQAASVNDVDIARKSHVQWVNTVLALESQVGTWRIMSQRRVEVAEANLRKAEANLADAQVVSPIDGVVLERYVENQQVVGLNEKLLLVAAPDDLLMMAAVDEEDVTRARLGQKVEMQLYAFQARDGSEKPRILEGKVIEVLPSANPSNKTYEVKVAFVERPEGLRVGMTGELNFIESESAKDGALTVPVSAVLDHKVYVSRGGGNYEPREVTIGIRTLERVEITSGVQGGEMVVADAKQVAPVKLPAAKQPVVPTRAGDEASGE